MGIASVLGNVADGLTGGAVSSLMGNIGGTGLGKMKRGAELDQQYFEKKFDYRINQGLEHGMTPYEMFMGPAAGGGGDAGPSAQTLGNQEGKKNIAAMQAASAEYSKDKDRQTSLAQTKMQTDAQKEVASIQAGETRHSTDTQASIAVAKLELENNKFQNVTLPQAAQTLKLTEQQVLKAKNEVVTSNPKFIKLLAVMKMSSENILATLKTLDLPFDVTDPESVRQASEQNKDKVVRAVLGLLSHTRREGTGIGDFFKQLAGDFKSLDEDIKKNNHPPFLGKGGGGY